MEYNNSFYEGIFWIDGYVDAKIIGTMHIDENGIVTISSLQSLEQEERQRTWEKIEHVFGYVNCHETSKNYSVKLYDVFKIHQSNGALTKYKYQSSNSYISPKFDDEISNLSFNSIMLNSSIISQWVKTTGFNLVHNDSEDDSFKVNQLYTQPKQINLFKDESYEIYFFFRASAGYPVRRSSFIKEEVFINVETKKQFNLKELYTLKAVIERLFNILLFTPFYSAVAEFKTTSGVNYKELSRPKELLKNLSNQVSFESFCASSQEIFTSWFDKQDEFELFIKNFFSVYGQKGVLVENKFLTYVSVLENFHKNNIKKEATLKDRLSHILNQSSISNKINNIDKYAEKLKVTRNYHSHLEEKHEKKALDVNGIIKSNGLLEIIIREIMLNELNAADVQKPNLTDQLFSDINEIIK